MWNISSPLTIDQLYEAGSLGYSIPAPLRTAGNGIASKDQTSTLTSGSLIAPKDAN